MGRIIRKVRKKNKLTLQQLADEMQTDRQYIWKVEQGKINIPADTLDVFIKKLDSNYAEFFNRKHII